jgi:hypothetical protein
MRAVSLAGAAAEAEGLRLRLQMRRMVRQCVFLAIAAVFAIAAFVILHMVAYAALPLTWEPWLRLATVLGGDVVVVVICVLVGTSGGQTLQEVQLKEVRNLALRQAAFSVWPLRGADASPMSIAQTVLQLFAQIRLALRR